MNNQIKNGLKNDSNKEHKRDMRFLTKITKAIKNMANLKTFILFMTLWFGAYIIMWTLFPTWPYDKFYGSMIVAVALTFISKYLEL